VRAVDDEAPAAAGAVFRDALEVDGESLVREQRSDRIVLNVKTIKGEYAEICAFPANPDTLRGFEGNVCFDEFGQMPFSEEMWKAAYPITGPTKANAEGYRLRVVGTPNGDANMFYKLANTDDGEQISWHWIDIYRAKADGFPIDIEAARKEIGDHDAFLQEYVVTFLSSGTRYIEEDRIQSYEDRECPKGGERYAGLDVAESPVGDLSAIEVVRKVGDVYWIEPDGWADRGVRFSTQKARVSGLLQEGVRRVAIDATGVGAEPAQTLSNDYPQRVDAVKFTNDSKEGLVTRLKRLTDEGLLRYPKGALDLRRDVLLMRRISLPGGGMRYDIERSRGGRGHGDRAWALALALHAAETGFKGVGGAVRLK
jgi:phage FluMu gp28-like protein